MSCGAWHIWAARVDHRVGPECIIREQRPAHGIHERPGAVAAAAVPLGETKVIPVPPSREEGVLRLTRFSVRRP